MTNEFMTSTWGVRMLELEAVSGGYPRHPVLKDISMSVPSGSKLAVLGRNGMGKTTLLRTIMGLVQAGGEISFEQQSIGHLPTYKRVREGIAFVPQGREIIPTLTVGENLKVASLVHPSDKRTVVIEKVLELFPQISGRLEDLGDSLSGGQQQILALARAMVSEPSLLLLDEPTEGIQPSILDEIVEILTVTLADRGMSIILAEQNLDFAARICDSVIVLEKGQIVHSGSMKELADDEELQRRLLTV